MSNVYFSPAWQQQSYAREAHLLSGTMNLRDRIKACYFDEEGGNQGLFKENEYLSPSDAFFGKPAASFVSQAKARQVPLPRPQKIHQAQTNVLDESKQPERPPTSLRELQATDSAISKTLIGHFIDTRDALYGGALEKLVEAKGQIEGVFAEATAENDRVLDDLEKHQKRTAKPLSETRINNNQSSETTPLGESVDAFRELTDTLAADVKSLWEQWGDAQKEVDSVFAELTDKQTGAAKVQPHMAAAAVKESLSREMENFEKELDGILEQSHEEVRLSEAHFRKQMKRVMDTLLQQFFME